jgi:hypothetical protein
MRANPSVYATWNGSATFEFGAALRPIDFAGWTRGGAALSPSDDSFWLTYWAAAYEAVLTATGANIYLFDYDRACEQPKLMLAALAKALDLQDAPGLIAQAARFRPPRPSNEAPGSLSGGKGSLALNVAGDACSPMEAPK